jgi:hypothetical protein
VCSRQVAQIFESASHGVGYTSVVCSVANRAGPINIDMQEEDANQDFTRNVERVVIARVLGLQHRHVRLSSCDVTSDCACQG